MALKENETLPYAVNKDEPGGYYAEPVTEGQIMHDSTCIRCPKQSNTQKQRVERCLQGAGRKGEIGNSSIGIKFHLCKMSKF